MCLTESKDQRISCLSLSAEPYGEASTLIRFAMRTTKKEKIIGVYLLMVEEKTDCRYETKLLLDESSTGFILFDSNRLSDTIVCELPLGGQYRITLVALAETDGCRGNSAMTIDYKHNPPGGNG